MFDLSTLLSPANLIGSLLFSSIGMFAFGYGKREGNVRILLLGTALFCYPYLVPQTWLLYTIGLTLCGCIWYCRDLG